MSNKTKSDNTVTPLAYGTKFLFDIDKNQLEIMRRTGRRLDWTADEAVEKAREMIALAQDWSSIVRSGEQFSVENLLQAQRELVTAQAKLTCYAAAHEEVAPKLWTAIEIVEHIVGFLGDVGKTLLASPS